MSRATDARERALAATVESAGRVGLARITVEEVAHRAGLSRATVYRYFPGGREQLVDEAITWEVGRFLARVADAGGGATTFRDRLARTMAFAHRAIEDHEVLQHVLETEPGGLLPQLRETAPLVIAVIADLLRPHLEAEALCPGVDPAAASDLLARMVLSFVVSAGGRDLDDPATVERVVDDLVAGVLA
jgi:AcrR family transcriptional regulator